MTKPSFLAILAIAVSSGTAVVQVVGQEPEPPPAVPTGEETTTSDLAVDLAKMTLEELVDEAKEAIITAEARGPDADDAMRRLGELLPAIRRRDPLNNDANFIDGRAKLLLGRAREAIQLIGEHYVKEGKGKNDWLAFKLLGDLYFQSKYYTMARGKYQRAVELSPREPEPYAGLARTELALARQHKAVEYARRAIDRDNPGSPSERNPKYHATLATALLGDRKPEEASEAVATAVELAREKARKDPTNPALLVELDSYNVLLEQIVQTIILNYPERAEEHAHLARVSQERAQITHLLSLHRILHTLEQGIEQFEPDRSEKLLLEKAKLLLAVGNVDEAVEVLSNLLDKDPDNAEAKQLLHSVRGPESDTPSGP